MARHPGGASADSSRRPTSSWRTRAFRASLAVALPVAAFGCSLAGLASPDRRQQMAAAIATALESWITSPTP